MKRITRLQTVPVDKRYKVFKPVMEVEPGESLTVETVNHMTPVVKSEADLHPHGSKEYIEREETGPIYVKGAKPGDALAIQIEKIDVVGIPHAQGWGLCAEINPQKPMLFPVEYGLCRLPGGVAIPVQPMIGDIYTTPGESGPQYYDHGGNMDFTEVKPGNTLFLPVYREGGLLVLGDVHALQGDGEIFGEGAECASDVSITIDIDRKYKCRRPLVETPDSLIVIACRDSLDEAIRLAVADMTDILVRVNGMSLEDAETLCYIAGSLRFAGCLAGKEWLRRPLIGLSLPKNMY